MHARSKTYRKALAAALLGAVMTVPSFAADLRQTPAVADAVIRLGDIFDGTGDKADTIIMEAPAPGKARQLSAADLDRIASQYDLAWERPAFLNRLRVLREGNSFSVDDLEGLVMAAAMEDGIENNVEVQIFGKKTGLYLPLENGIADITLESFDLSPRKDRFTAVALVPTGTGEPERLAISGRLEEVRLIPSLARMMTPGEIITASDIEWVNVPVRRVNTRVLTSQNDLLGQTVKRALQPGHMLYSSDVALPVVVEKGTAVVMTLKAGALALSAAGRALENGGTGDVIRVMNTKSKQTVDARIIAPGQVEVTSNTLTLAAM